MTQNTHTKLLLDDQKEKRVKAKYIEQMNPYVAGIDIGSRSHFVAAPLISGNSHYRVPQREKCYPNCPTLSRKRKKFYLETVLGKNLFCLNCWSR